MVRETWPATIDLSLSYQLSPKSSKKIVNNLLIAYLNKFYIISDSQYGFGQGTEDAILKLTTIITDSVDYA